VITPGQAVEVTGLGDPTPEDTETAIICRQLIVPANPLACSHHYALAIEVRADEPLHVLQDEQQAAGCYHRRERMAGAGNAYAEILPRAFDLTPQVQATEHRDPISLSTNTATWSPRRRG
jgi:hypothetical protein